MLDENLLWLINWYSQQCDGDWEHSFGIEISSMTNPGWGITVSVQETELKDKIFQEIDLQRSDEDWVFCRVKKGFFEGRCGTFNLVEVLQIFKEWVED
jgi:hypothetical protein